MHNRSCTRKTTETDIERVNHGKHGRHGKRGITEWRLMKTNHRRQRTKEKGNWTNSKRNAIYNRTQQEMSNHGKQRKTRKKVNHRMKTNENEPQKAMLERERKIERIRSKTLIYNRTQQEMSNHGKHGRHGRRWITEWRPMKTNTEGDAGKRKKNWTNQCETPEYAQTRQDRSQPRKTRKTRKKGYHRMKTNEN